MAIRMASRNACHSYRRVGLVVPPSEAVNVDHG
jgi:hypothetical protein